MFRTIHLKIMSSLATYTMLLYIIYNQVISLSYLEQIGGTPPRKVNLRSQSQKGKKIITWFKPKI